MVLVKLKMCLSPFFNLRTKHSRMYIFNKKYSIIKVLRLFYMNIGINRGHVIVLLVYFQINTSAQITRRNYRYWGFYRVLNYTSQPNLRVEPKTHIYAGRMWRGLSL